MKQYHDLLKDVLENGIDSDNRTGIVTKSLFGRQIRFDLSKGFPAITTKKLAWKSVVAELLWFLEGSTDERRLAELTYGKDRTEVVGKNTIWLENAEAQGKQLGHFNNQFIKELGPVYGFQWRNFDGDYNSGSEDAVHSARSYVKGKDQILELIYQIKQNPNSRRLIVSAWNANQTDIMSLPPCHVLSMFRVYNNKLSCMMFQRSCDLFLGAPFNIASYALLTHILARECNLEVGEFIYDLGDVHIYKNHIDQVQEQLSREEYDLPTLKIDENFDLSYGLEYAFGLEDAKYFSLENYKSHDSIRAPMAV